MVPGPAQVAPTIKPHDIETGFTVFDAMLQRMPGLVALYSMILGSVLFVVLLSVLLLYLILKYQKHVDERDKAIREDERNRKG